MILQPTATTDADRLAAVHAESFAEPWNAAAIAEVIGLPGAFGFLIRPGEDGPAAGFALARAVAGEAELLTLAVAPPMRRQGLGQALVNAIAARGQAAGATSLFLEVAHDNVAALKLYEALGFRQVGRRRGYYLRKDGPADALVLQRDLNSTRP